MIILANKSLYRIEKQVNHRLLGFYWLNSAQSITFEEFQQSCSELTEYILKENPIRLIISFLDINYIITYEMQQWFIQNQSNIWLNTSLKKIAIIVNHNLLTHNSIDELIFESYDTYNKMIEYKYFDNNESALKWLVN